jgi:hypothetical protein
MTSHARRFLDEEERLTPGRNRRFPLSVVESPRTGDDAGNVCRQPCVTATWAAKSGPPLGKLVFVKIAILRLKYDLAVQKLTLEQSAETGTMASMNLVDPAALGG